jgi:hypothetical protein
VLGLNFSLSIANKKYNHDGICRIFRPLCAALCSYLLSTLYDSLVYQAGRWMAGEWQLYRCQVSMHAFSRYRYVNDSDAADLTIICVSCV